MDVRCTKMGKFQLCRVTDDDGDETAWICEKNKKGSWSCVQHHDNASKISHDLMKCVKGNVTKLQDRKNKNQKRAKKKQDDARNRRFKFHKCAQLFIRAY